MKEPLKIKLNEEQTKKFLSFFVEEAIEIIKKRNKEKQEAGNPENWPKGKNIKK
jgi:hypothetical protein